MLRRSAGGRWRWASGRGDRRIIVALGAIPAALTVGLLLVVPVVGFVESTTDWSFTLRHYEEIWGDSVAYRTLLNTFAFVGVTLFWALLFGVPLAWLVERTDLRGKRLIWASMMVGILIPGFFTATGWLFMLHPRIGVVNQWLMDGLGLEKAPFNIQSILGMGFVEGLQLTAFVFFFSAASLRAMNPVLEEAAQMSGASLLTSLRRVTLPLAKPGLLGAVLYTTTLAFSAFDTPLVLGLSDRIYVFSTFLYSNTASSTLAVPVYGPEAAFASFMMVLALGLSWFYAGVLKQSQRYAVITGKDFRPRLRPLGKWRPLAFLFVASFLGLSLGFPVLLLAWTSLQSYIQPITVAAFDTLSLDNYGAIPWATFGEALTNSLLLMLVVPIGALVISLIFSWIILRSGYRFRMAFEYVAFVPQAVPIVILTFAALIASLYIITEPVFLYGTLTLIAIVMTLGLVSFGSRITNAALIQLHPELEEAAQMSGASTFTALRRVSIPLLRPALAFGWLWMALLVFRQLPTPLMLLSTDNVTASTFTYNLFSGSQPGVASAISVMTIVALVGLALVYLKVSKGDAQARVSW